MSILFEALRFSALEVAEVLAMSVAAVSSSLQRGRAGIAGRLPHESQHAELQRLGDKRVLELARQYADAIDRGDVEALMKMLTTDATWSMPPHPAYYEPSLYENFESLVTKNEE